MPNALINLPNLRYQRIILIVLVFLAFGKSISNGYSLDDEIVTTKANKKVTKGFSGIPEILTTPYSTGFNGKDNFDYRPVTLITFVLEKEIFGYKPGLSHLVNLLLYIGLILLIFSVMRNLLSDYPEWIAFLVVVIFTLHPLHSEVVVSLKNREEILVSLFGFLATFSLLHFLKNKNFIYLLGAFLFIGMGINTKLSASPFLLFIPFSLVLFNKISWPKGGLLFISLIIFCGFSFFLPRSIFEEGELLRAVDYFENPLNFMPVEARFPMIFYSFLIYLKLHFVPYPLLSYYGYNEIEILDWSDYPVYLGVLAFILMVFLIIKTYNTNKLLVFGLTSFLIFIAPFLNFPHAVTGIIAERFAFNSILGFSSVAVALLYSHPFSGVIRTIHLKNRKYVFQVLGVIGLAWIVIDFSRTGDWDNLQSLMRKDAKVADQSVKLQIMYGDAIQQALGETTNEAQRIEYIRECVIAYQTVLNLYPQHAGTYNNLGVVYSMSGNYKNAITYIKKAIELGENKAENYFNLAACYEISGDFKNAAKYYNITLQKQPNYRPALDRMKEMGEQEPIKP